MGTVGGGSADLGTMEVCCWWPTVYSRRGEGYWFADCPCAYTYRDTIIKEYLETYFTKSSSHAKNSVSSFLFSSAFVRTGSRTTSLKKKRSRTTSLKKKRSRTTSLKKKKPTKKAGYISGFDAEFQQQHTHSYRLFSWWTSSCDLTYCVITVRTSEAVRMSFFLKKKKRKDLFAQRAKTNNPMRSLTVNWKSLFLNTLP